MKPGSSQAPLPSNSFDPSRYRRQHEFLPSGETKKYSAPVVSSPRSDYPENLQDFVRLMKSANVEGPHLQPQVHLGGKPLGSGAQFDVFGHQHFVHESFTPFDLPYVSKIQGSGKAPVVVAIKRARFIHSYTAASISTSQQFGFGTPEQLRALALEVRTLSNSAIHNHRNIVKLLAWGFDFGDRGTRVEPLSLILILEHGNCSLRHFLSNHNRKIPQPPEQVLQKLGLDVAQGLSALHDAEIIHGDIKTDNVLVFPAEAPFFCIAKLSDFGFSVLDMDENQKIYNIGTLGWQAPELNDVGVTTNMLKKCDYFSLGLLILRTVVRANNGYQKTGLEEVSEILKCANISQPTQNCIRDVMQYLLPSNPHKRASDLGKVCDRLSQMDQQEFDRTGNWVQDRFDDDTPWKEYEVPANGYSMILGAYQYFQARDKKKGIEPPKKTENPNYSWVPIYKFLEEIDDSGYASIASHYVNGIDEISRKPQVNISGDLVGREINGYQLLGLCFSGRLGGSGSDVDRARVYRRKRGACAAVSAMRGYLPAQAICKQLLGDSDGRFRETLEANDPKWQRNAVASGFLLAWKFAYEYPEEHALALSDFRRSGGYNAHYANNTIKKESTYSPSGLLYDVQGPLEWLKSYPLHRAAALGQTPEVRRLLESGYDIDSLDVSGETPLQRACMAGHASTTRYLVKKGADVTLKSKLLGTVPLHWLFVFEPSEASHIADMLVGRERENLEEESNIEADAFHFPFKWPSGSPIAWSVLSNRYEAISALLRHGSSLDSIPDFFPGLPDWPEEVLSDDMRSNRQNRNLFKAWIYKPVLQYQHSICRSSFKYLVKRSALEGLEKLDGNRLDSRVVDRHGGELQTAVVEGDFDVVKRLIESGADVNASPSKRDTPLLAAIAAKKPDIVKLLLDNGARFDLSPDPFDGGPLQRAAKSGNVQITSMLLEAGADVNTQSEKSEFTGTALYEASRLGGIDILEMLLGKGADCNIIGGQYGTPLQRAACAEKLPLEKVKLLLKHRADPNLRAGYHETALQAAASAGNGEAVKILLQAGADPNIEGGQLWTALQAAVIPVNYQNHEVIDALLERKVDVNSVGGEFGTALEAAASGGDESLVEKLLRAGALPNIKGGKHGTALQAATWTGNLKLVQLLLEAGADPDIGGGTYYSTPIEAAIISGKEEIVKLLLSNGADPGVLGEVDKILLMVERRGGEVGGMEQLLLDWGAKPSAEKAPPKNPSHPLSWLEFGHVRNLLRQRFQMVTGGKTVPKHLPDMILRQAQYLPQISARSDNSLRVTKSTPEEACLRAYVGSAPAPDIRPCQIYFEIQSHDNGNVKPSQRDGPYGKSDTFFEVEVHSPRTGKTRRIPLQKNFHGSRCLRTHKITWDIDGVDSNVSNMISALAPGDELRVFAKCSGDSNINYVESVEVRVLYHYAEEKKGPIHAPSAGADERQNGEINEKPNVPHQHPNGITTSNQISANENQPGASSNQQSEKPSTMAQTALPSSKKRGFRDFFCCCFGGS